MPPRAIQGPTLALVILFALSLADGVANPDRPVQSLESPPDLFRPRERLARGGMRSDEASGIDDHRPDVGRRPVGHPRDVPVTLRLQQRVEQVDVLLGKRLGRRGLVALPREDGRVGDMDGALTGRLPVPEEARGCPMGASLSERSRETEPQRAVEACRRRDFR